jgi:hypothetical protein
MAENYTEQTNLQLDKGVEVDKESLEMNNLALSNVTKYLATYNNPREWILDEKEAKAARILSDVRPDKSSKIGSLAYSGGELLRTTYAAPRQFAGAISAGVSALKDRFYPNAEKSALERWADNYAKIEAQREKTNQELISQEVGHEDWYTIGAAAAGLARDIALIGGIAKLGAVASKISATKKIAGLNIAEDVASRYAGIAAGQGAKKAGGAAISGSVFVQEVGSGMTDDISQYMEKTGDYELKYYDPSVDLAVNVGVGALSAQIEKGLGVERFVPRLMASGKKIPGWTQILGRATEGYVGESTEEGAQETLGQIGDMIKGYRDWWDFDSDKIWTSMTIGGALGGVAGGGLYYINRRTAINRLTDQGLDRNTAADLVDTIASIEINKTINNLSASTELNNKSGQAYDKLKAGIKNALELQGWNEKMVDQKTGKPLSIDEYVDLTVNSQLINTAIKESFNSGISIDEFLDVAQFVGIDNFMTLRPLGTPEQIQARIDEQDAIIKRQTELKKTGAGDATALSEARMKKAILQKVKLNKIVSEEIQKVNVEESKTPEIKQEIENATNDVDTLTKSDTASDFNAELDNKSTDGQTLTTDQKIKRLGNAVIKKIFGSDKLGFDSVMTLPEYTNARTAITNSADRIFNFAKKHRKYGIYTDLRNALKAMSTVNQSNFLEHATTPNLDGTDVIAQNAFLYHFLFKDADTTTAFIDAYLERAEASIAGETLNLSKKDLVGQAFKATDNLMQVQAESVGIEYNSIYNEDGSYKDKNVAAVMMSYQNQFADDSQAKTAEEQKEIEEVAAQVVDGTATTGTPESVSENFIQDYGEKIEGAKKDLVPKTEQEKTENQVIGLLKRSKFTELQIFEFNKWAQEQPYELLEKILSSKVTLYATVSLDARRFIRDNDLYDVSVEERQQRVRDAGIRLFDFYFKKPKGRVGELTVEALDAYVNARKQIQFTYQASTRGKLFLWGKKGNGGWLPLVEFATKEEMQIHKDRHTQEDLEKLYTDMTSYKQGERKVIRPRTGVDYRNGKNVTEKDFAEQFGFRGVQFGNYENQQKRQREINNSYDSFMDLATLLNIPPKAISLGGTLGIAFGARGSGSAAAHYEPDLKVINITRDSGAGALAHEWFHALDNYLAQNITNASKDDFLTNIRKRRIYSKNLDLNEALADYIWELGKQTDFQARLRLLGQYWRRDWEIAARIFEQYVSAKIAEQNGINDYLASPQDYYLAETPYLKEDEAKNVFPYIEKIIKALKVQETTDGNVILYQPEEFDLADENARLDDIYPAYTGETIEVDGKERTVYNSNGDRIAKSAEALRNFYKWFGDSKVVDEQGRPLVVYHGTDAEFDTFDMSKGRSTMDIQGAFFSPWELDSKGYGSNVRAFYIKLEKPANEGVAYKELNKHKGQTGAGTMARESLVSMGYDGVNNSGEEYIVFKPENIKSVDNRGTYSSDTGNIYYQGKQANGFFDPELNVVLLGKNWNTMTLPHEFAHYWLNTLFNVYKRVQAGELQASADWIAEKKDMFAMLGINENQQALTTGQQEKFARMTEAYLTGIGVGKEMNQTFKDYFAWVPEKYKSILQLGYLDDQGKIQYPFLDQKAVDFFNRWYENASLPSLATSPERQRFMNATDENGDVQKVSIKEMNDREKEFAQDAEEQYRTDQRLYNTLDENMPANIKPAADAQKVAISERSNFLKESQAEQNKVSEEPKRRWFERKSRETETQLAQEYIEKNPEHAKEVIFGDPEFVANDTGVDRATLINTYMAMNNITPNQPEWATLHTNIAINQSLAGTQLALSNDKSYGTYLDALREIENVLEMKAATNYAGSKQGARERFNADIQRFLDRELPSIFATEPNSKERETALRMMFEKARTTFSGNTTGTFLNQMDLSYAISQKGKSEAFIRWATNQIKKDAGAKLNNEQQAKLLEVSAKAQQALVDLDSQDTPTAVAAAQELRKWQLEKQKLMGVSPQKFSLMGDWAPRAMLASFNTLVVANVPSTAINTAVTNLTKTGLFGKNKVSKNLIDGEIKRIKAIYGATAMNLAQMEKPTSPSLLHGEKYSASGQKWYDPYTILGKEDNFFRVPTFVNTLAQIASKDAEATGRNADDVFKEYLSLNNQSDEAKLARKQALAVSNMAVFTQNGALASCLNHIRSELNKLSRVTFGLDPQGFGLGNLIAPFLTTGANIAEMGIRGSLAPITTITTMVNKWRTGKALDPMKKLALRMDWTYFTLSAVSMVLLSALTSDDDDFYTDPYRTGRKYDPNKPYDSINIAGVWLDLDFFGPFSIPMRTAAKVIQAWKKDNGIVEGIAKGYGESAKEVLGDIPLVESIVNNQFNWAVKKPGAWASSYLYTQANKLVPAQIKPISRVISRSQDWIFEPGGTVGRKFNRNYGFDGTELTTQDLIEMFTIKLQLDERLNQKL